MPFAKDSTAALIRADGLYVLTEPLTWTGSTRDPAKRQILTVLAGFITDLASVPKVLRALMNVAGRNDRPAILHDSLCEAQRLAWQAGRKPEINSVDTDGIFRAALREVGIRRLERELYWIGVRWGAVASPYRRAGWWRTLPRLLAVSIPLLPLLAVYLPGVLITAAVLWGLGSLLDRWDAACPPRRAANMSRERAAAERGGRDFLLVQPWEPINHVSVGKLTGGVLTANIAVLGRHVTVPRSTIDGPVEPDPRAVVAANLARTTPGTWPRDAADRFAQAASAALSARELHAPGAEDPNCATCKRLLCDNFPDCPPEAPHMQDDVQ